MSVCTLYVYIYACMYVCVCMYVMYAWMYVCMCVCAGMYVFLTIVLLGALARCLLSR